MRNLMKSLAASTCVGGSARARQVGLRGEFEGEILEKARARLVVNTPMRQSNWGLWQVRSFVP